LRFSYFMKELNFSNIIEAHNRIKDYIVKTPVISNEILSKKFGARIFLKMENQQFSKSFKERGAFNAILAYKEKHGNFPPKIVAQSSGNHAQAIARVAKEFGLEALIYMTKTVSPLKIARTRELGATVILCDRRIEANKNAEEKTKEGYFFIHPADGEYVISGQGTACFEALNEIGEVDLIFAPCGGGGLVVGSYLASLGLSKNAKTFACEPKNANDVAMSVEVGAIVGFEDTPNTIADGARTLRVTEQSFFHLQKLAGVLEIEEEKIDFWQKELSEILGQKIEPTSALTIAGIEQYLEKNPNLKNQRILAIVSGGNIN
jgi:threo-3-hydroxy-L-aspartate ammonia-lyase